MTREEAERRKTEESRRSGMQTSAFSMESQREAHQAGSLTEQDPSMSPAVEKTMAKAQKQTDKSTPTEKGRGGSEEEKPERILRTTEDPRSSSLLPVVSEVGENGSHGSQRSEKRALSPADERPEYDSELSTSPPPMDHSIPGLRRVSPSTVGTATDMADDTSLSSPQAVDFEPSVHTDGDGDDSVKEYVPPSRPDKPPRIGSDLIQPTSPLSESLMQSIHEHMGDD